MTKRILLKNRIRCLKCKDVVESKTRHDFVWCKCKSVAVDGGLTYCKRVGISWTDACVWDDESTATPNFQGKPGYLTIDEIDPDVIENLKKFLEIVKDNPSVIDENSSDTWTDDFKDYNTVDGTKYPNDCDTKYTLDVDTCDWEWTDKDYKDLESISLQDLKNHPDFKDDDWDRILFLLTQ